MFIKWSSLHNSLKPVQYHFLKKKNNPNSSPGSVPSRLRQSLPSHFFSILEVLLKSSIENLQLHAKDIKLMSHTAAHHSKNLLLLFHQQVSDTFLGCSYSCQIPQGFHKTLSLRFQQTVHIK